MSSRPMKEAMGLNAFAEFAKAFVAARQQRMAEQKAEEQFAKTLAAKRLEDEEARKFKLATFYNQFQDDLLKVRKNTQPQYVIGDDGKPLQVAPPLYTDEQAKDKERQLTDTFYALPGASQYRQPEAQQPDTSPMVSNEYRRQRVAGPFLFGTEGAPGEKVTTKEDEIQKTIRNLGQMWRSAREALDNVPTSMSNIGTGAATKLLGGERTLGGVSFGSDYMQTYNALKPTLAVGLYRALARDPRINENDARDRAMPLLPNVWPIPDTAEVRKAKIRIIEDAVERANRGEVVDIDELIKKIPSSKRSSPFKGVSQDMPTPKQGTVKVRFDANGNLVEEK